MSTALKILMLTAILPVNKSPERYKDTVFKSVKLDTAIEYSQAGGVYGREVKLKMDVYLPDHDSEKMRPAIIFLHGGAFMYGRRTDDYAVEFCRQFAQRGYVTVSADYRTGIADRYNPMAYGDAVYRAVQDARAAVRYIRANAGKFGIDPEKIYIGGGSAGAIAALQAAYWDQKSVPPYMDTRKLGNLDETGDYREYSSHVSGVINCWGAVIDTSCLRNAAIPVVNIHGVDDPVVPYKNIRMGQFSLYGSYCIYEKAKELKIPTVLKAFPDTGHGLKRSDTAKWNATLETISDFMYMLVNK
jgi:acetyl esterase/lipase